MWEEDEEEEEAGARDLFTLQRLEGGNRRGGRGINKQVKGKSQTRLDCCTNKGRRHAGQGESDASRV